MKKLSRLQRFILKQAYKNSVIQNSDILIRWYRFVPIRQGACKFDPNLIGTQKYNSASVSVARSITRLRNRGLMRRLSSPWGHGLTYLGREVVGEWSQPQRDKKENNG